MGRGGGIKKRRVRDVEKGGGGMEVGEREIIYLSLYCHHQNNFCIVRDKVTRQCPQTTTFEEKGQSKRISPGSLSRRGQIRTPVGQGLGGGGGGGEGEGEGRGLRAVVQTIECIMQPSSSFPPPFLTDLLDRNYAIILSLPSFVSHKKIKNKRLFHFFPPDAVSLRSTCDLSGWLAINY